MVTEAEKAFIGKVCSQAFLVYLPDGRVWESRLNICLILWAHTTNEGNETTGWPAPPRCHSQSPLKGHGNFKEGPNNFRKAEMSHSS